MENSLEEAASYKPQAASKQPEKQGSVGVEKVRRLDNSQFNNQGGRACRGARQCAPSRKL
jgi:hypothetical protein